MSDINDYTNQIHTGDAFDVLPELPTDSIHACVTDPPYGLNFMGKDWDNFRRKRNEADAGRDNVFGRTSSTSPASGAETEGKRYQEWCEEWAREVKRVLKPGGHLLAFSGNRTHHRLFSGVEDAGFEIRDTVTWHYGSGFPKALDVSKAIDKQSGRQRKEIAETLQDARNAAGMSRDELADAVGCTPSSVRDWEEGRARSEGDPVEWVVPSPEYREKLASVLPEYPTEAEREVVGSYEEGDRDGVFDGETSGFGSGDRTVSETDAAERWEGFKTALKPATEYVVVARKPLSEGTVAENVQTHGTGALNIDGTRIVSGERPERESGTETHDRNMWDETSTIGNGSKATGTTTEGRYPSNVVFDETEAERLDREVGDLGQSKGVRGQTAPNGKYGDYGSDENGKSVGKGDSGGPSRYFYTSKASKAERTLDGAIENAHPTVKPADLMEWLVTLVTAEGQSVLDPFAGSGTTCRAAKDLGRQFVGIEKQAKWADVARVRAGLTPDDPSTVRADGVTGLDAFTDGGAE